MIDIVLALKYLAAFVVFFIASFIFVVGCVRIWFSRSWLKPGDIYYNKKTKEEETETNFPDKWCPL